MLNTPLLARQPGASMTATSSQQEESSNHQSQSKTDNGWVMVLLGLMVILACLATVVLGYFVSWGQQQGASSAGGSEDKTPYSLAPIGTSSLCAGWKLSLLDSRNQFSQPIALHADHSTSTSI